MSNPLKLTLEEQKEILEMVVKVFGDIDTARSWLKDIPIIKENGFEGVLNHEFGAVYAVAMLKLMGYTSYPLWFSTKYEASVNTYMKTTARARFSDVPLVNPTEEQVRIYPTSKTGLL